MPSEKRYFTVDEANTLVPWLQERFTCILQMRSQIRGLYQSLERLGHRPDPESLARDDGPTEVRTQRARFVGLMEALHQELAAITSAGIEIKDLDTGLCDFYSLHEGREVYLCWKLGEARIDFFHDLHAGFAGRQPLPRAREHGEPSSQSQFLAGTPGKPRVLN
mgnify:CR=1 FL=1